MNISLDVNRISQVHHSRGCFSYILHQFRRAGIPWMCLIWKVVVKCQSPHEQEGPSALPPIKYTTLIHLKNVGICSHVHEKRHIHQQRMDLEDHTDTKYLVVECRVPIGDIGQNSKQCGHCPWENQGVHQSLLLQIKSVQATCRHAHTVEWKHTSEQHIERNKARRGGGNTSSGSFQSEASKCTTARTHEKYNTNDTFAPTIHELRSHSCSKMGMRSSTCTEESRATASASSSKRAAH